MDTQTISYDQSFNKDLADLYQESETSDLLVDKLTNPLREQLQVIIDELNEDCKQIQDQKIQLLLYADLQKQLEHERKITAKRHWRSNRKNSR